MFVHFLNNYWGDCALVEIPEGDGTYTNLLIDMGYGRDDPNSRPGGIKTLKFFMKNFISLPNRRIHHAIISHWHDDHYNDFDKLLSDKEIAPISVWVPNYLPDYRFTKETWKFIRRFHDKFNFIQADPNPIIKSRDKRVYVEVIGPQSYYLNKVGPGRRTPPIFVDPNFQLISTKRVQEWREFPTASVNTINNYSMVLRINFCQKVVLFPGDVESTGWHNLVQAKYGTTMWSNSASQVMRCDLLKISHHGKENLTMPFRPLPQYAVCTRFINEKRKLDSEGRDLLDAFEVFVRRSGDMEQGLVEEVFHIGGDQLKNRVACSFAFVPNRAGTNAIIVPIIYKLSEYHGNDPQLFYFIRPAERDCI